AGGGWWLRCGRCRPADVAEGTAQYVTMARTSPVELEALTRGALRGGLNSADRGAGPNLRYKRASLTAVSKSARQMPSQAIPTLITERLTLRAPVAGDFPAYARLLA